MSIHFVSTVNQDLFGTSDGSSLRILDQGSLVGENTSTGLTTGNSGLIGSQLNTAVDNAVAYNVAISTGEGDTADLRATFDTQFDGANGFQARYNNSVDQLAAVNQNLLVSTADGYEAFALGATLHNADGTPFVNGQLQIDYGSSTGAIGRGTTELDAGGAAYAQWILNRTAGAQTRGADFFYGNDAEVDPNTGG